MFMNKVVGQTWLHALFTAISNKCYQEQLSTNNKLRKICQVNESFSSVHMVFIVNLHIIECLSKQRTRTVIKNYQKL